MTNLEILLLLGIAGGGYYAYTLMQSPEAKIYAKYKSGELSMLDFENLYKSSPELRRYADQMTNKALEVGTHIMGEIVAGLI